MKLSCKHAWQAWRVPLDFETIWLAQLSVPLHFLCNLFMDTTLQHRFTSYSY